ncbi:AMP-dependent synthetase and ligase [Mycena floridula]|nr:AMP-dependent synthetase and ligase [Mycena floridula]
MYEFIQAFCLPTPRSLKTNDGGRSLGPNATRLGPNDRVLLLLPTGPINAVALLAIAAYHTCAPVNSSCTAAELKEDAVRLGAKAIVTTREVLERLTREMGGDRLTREMGGEEGLGLVVIVVEERVGAGVGIFDMEVLGDDGSGSIGEDGSGSEYTISDRRASVLSDQSLVLHTSGTSGKKKVVPYTLMSLIVGTWAVVESWGLKEGDVNMNMMPLFHVGGIVRNLLAPMLSGGSAIMCAGFDAIAFWTLAKELKATWYYAAPTIHHAILTSQPSHINPARDLRLRMICNAAGGLLPSLAIELRERFGGAVVLPSYGMTECMPISTPPTTYTLSRPGTSGLPCGPHLSIRNPTNIELEVPAGQTGSVCVRGLPTFQGYETNRGEPLDTSCFSSEGWFDSGDMGYTDNDGYLYITGRSKEIINKGGEVISPFEVEEAISTAAKEYVDSVLAFAIEHEVLQESIGVVLVMKPGKMRIGLGRLNELLRDCLHPSKWPFAIVYMDGLPKNSAGKPLRIKLATRLNLGVVSDTFSTLQRHYEADVPDPMSSLSDPIRCNQVTIDLEAIQNTMRRTCRADEVAVRLKNDGSPEAYIALSENPFNDPISPSSIKSDLSTVLPGYAIPSPLNIFSHPLIRTHDKQLDFAAMEREIATENSSAMSQTALRIRDIIADILALDSNSITSNSDFFLLGGNSLLLGKLKHAIRKATGADITIADVFANSTVGGIAELVEAQKMGARASQETLREGSETVGHNGPPPQSANTSITAFSVGGGSQGGGSSRGQMHPVSLMVQAIPFIFFYPLKAALTWTFLLFILSYMAPLLTDSFWFRTVSLLIAILVARMVVRIVCPVTAILFKWMVIGRYERGRYKMWSTYHLRWWIVNQALRTAGRGIFSLTAPMQTMYFRLLGAKIGHGVCITPSSHIAELDLLDIGDDVRIDGAVVRGFAVEQDGYFRLGSIRIGRGATINTYTQIAPDADIAEGSVYGPHSSSWDKPSPESYRKYNRTLREEPHWGLKVFVAWPVIILVEFISLLPWFATIYLMTDFTVISHVGLNSMEAVIYWFAAPERVAFHAMSRIVRTILTPLLHLVFSILVKRLIGLNKPCSAEGYTQKHLLRRYISTTLLSRQQLATAFGILGTHYEVVSVVYRLMGARIGKRVYWPGSGIVCDEPEMLSVGDDVVFGSRSELFTNDAEGTGRISIDDGAMIADRVVLLPNTHIGRKTVMGSGALGKRDTIYADGSTWMGCENGEAICFSRGSAKDNNNNTKETITPFGRAFYLRQAPFFVLPYPLILIINILVAAASSAYWSISAVSAAQLLRTFHIHCKHLHLFAPRFYRFGILYGLIASFFVIILNIQAVLALFWVIGTKRLVIGQRRAGPCAWDQSSYCQRWQLHLVLSRPVYKGYGIGGVLGGLTGSAYIVWFYRAMGAKIGRNCAVWAGGRVGLMTEPDLVELGNDVSLDACSVVAHINSRGNFALNPLKIGDACALRSGSRLLSGASMEPGSMLLEHTLLTSGEIADGGAVYVGWPGRRMEDWKGRDVESWKVETPAYPTLVCPICRAFPKNITVNAGCGHLFCGSCISKVANAQGDCPVCHHPTKVQDLLQVQPYFV